VTEFSEELKKEVLVTKPDGKGLATVHRPRYSEMVVVNPFQGLVGWWFMGKQMKSGFA
jgi:hypothetical protein